MRERVSSLGRRVMAVGWVDSHRRAYVRANGLRFTRWAAGIALFGYLALFPLLVLAFIVFAVVLARVPSVQEQVQTFLETSLPLLFDPQGGQSPVDIERVAKATMSAGVVAVVGLLYAGLGWVGATLEGVRRMQGALRRPKNAVYLKLQDAGALLAMGTVLLLALVGSVLVEALGSQLLSGLGVSERATWALKLSAALVSGLLVLLTVAALYLFAWWGRETRRVSVVLKGSALVSVVLVVMVRLAFVLVGRTLSNPVYGTLAVAAALLLFLYFSSIVVLYGACWVAVREGAPRTAEEVAYAARRDDGTAELPSVSPGSLTDGAAGATTPPR